MQAHTASDSPRRGRRGRGAYLPDRLGSSLPASAQIGLRRRTQLTPRIRLYPNCISELIPAAALLSPPARQQRSSSHTRDSLASETVGRTKDRYMAKGRYKRGPPVLGSAACPWAQEKAADPKTGGPRYPVCLDRVMMLIPIVGLRSDLKEDFPSIQPITHIPHHRQHQDTLWNRAELPENSEVLGEIP